jgi:YedE family putative selenium metabolism protein
MATQTALASPEHNLMERLTIFFTSRLGVIIVGGLIGFLAVFLQNQGNPPNMGLCMACFERDIAGAIGLHRVSAVQYIRPEIIALVLGAMISALLFNEFRARAGSAPIVRFLLGVFAMIGALTFLGCPWRTMLRLSAGDLNAFVGLLGLIVGIVAGGWFLKKGYTLGDSRQTPAVVGMIMPSIMLLLLVFLVLRPQFYDDGPIFFSQSGPGSLHAPVLLSLGVGLLIGFMAQRTHFCTVGPIRNAIFKREMRMFNGIVALVVVAFLTNVAFGQFKVGFELQPIAHSNHLWNFLGMVLSGLAYSLAGGCPGRQLFLSGEGDGDAAVFVLGMIVGAGIVHNFALAGVPDALNNAGELIVGGPNAYGQLAVILGLVVCIVLGFTMRARHQT